MGGNPITTGRIGRTVYDLRHWKQTLAVLLIVGLPLLVFRFLSGRNLVRGGRSTDATFLRGARSVRKGWWNDQSGAARAGLRLAVIAGLWLWTVAPTVVYILLALELVVVVLSAHRKYREQQHVKRVLRPVWPAVAGIIGIPESESPSRWLDIPRAILDDPTAPDAELTVGLRAADADDERRVAALVQLFDQRFGVAHHGQVDYARRLVHVRVRPEEPAVWPAVANVLGVPVSDLASAWLQVPADPGTPGSRIVIKLPSDVVNADPIAKDLKALVNQRFVGEWSSTVLRVDQAVVLTHKAPTPEPPKRVDFFEHMAREEAN